MLRQQMAILWILASAAAVAAPQTPSPEYRFAPGDVIEVTVTPQHTYGRVITVRPDGKISYPIVGEVPVSGLTVAKLTETLRKGLDRDLVDPVVTVSLQKEGERETGHVSLLGAVHSPNSYPIKEGTTLTELLASAGGSTADADLRHVAINHADGSVSSVDVSSTETIGQVDRTLQLHPGDIIVVPQGPPSTVLVEGEVNRPGPVPIQHDSRLLDAIALAGGMTSKADTRRITVAHAGVSGSRALDLQPLLFHGDSSNPDINVRLQPGDTIFVPNSPEQIYVVGNVSKPDSYPLHPNERVLDAVVQAGGAGGGASKVVLVRRDAAGNQQHTTLDLKKIMSVGDEKENQLLQPGDMLYVEEKNHSGGLGNLLPLTSLLYLFHL
jgi:polysaccharide export outer membrane protein